jgi:hypothetical protein
MEKRVSMVLSSSSWTSAGFQR